jgi:tRNA G26 N,N-dimethylase Trm1
MITENNKGENSMNNKIMDELEKAGYDASIAIATQAEIEAKAACGQLSMVVEQDEKNG